MVLNLQVVQSVLPTRTSLKIYIGPWDTLKTQVAHLDQGIQSITNHWSTKKASYQKKGIEAFAFTAQQAEKYQAFVGSHFVLLPIRNRCLAKGWVVWISVITL